MANIGNRRKGIISSGYGIGQQGIFMPGGFDPDANAFFAAVVGAGGTLSATVKNEYDAFVLREKSNNRYSKIIRLYPYLGGVIDSARIDAISLGSATNNNFLDADADSMCGLQPDGSTKWLIDSAPASIFTSVDDNQLFHFIATPEGVTATFVGCQNTTAGTSFLLLETASDTRHAVGDVAIAAISVVAASNAAIIGGRFTSTDIRIWVDGANQNQNTSSNALGFPPETIYIFARNRNGAANTPSGSKGFGTMLGEGMTTSELLACQASYKTFLTNIGAI